MKYKGRSAASSLVFQVEAIPQTIETLHATKETPVEVKLKVRKKRNKKDMILTVPNYLIPNADPSKIQPLESNQTLVTFNMLMEKSSSLASGKNIGTLKRLMVATKGGGCLDPPYEEDIYSYQPKRKTKELRKDSQSKKTEKRNSKLSETSTKKFMLFSRKQKASKISKMDSETLKTSDVLKIPYSGELSTHVIYSNKKPVSVKQSSHDQTQIDENTNKLDKLEQVTDNIESQHTIRLDIVNYDKHLKTSPGVSIGDNLTVIAVKDAKTVLNDTKIKDVDIEHELPKFSRVEPHINPIPHRINDSDQQKIFNKTEINDSKNLNYTSISKNDDPLNFNKKDDTFAKELSLKTAYNTSEQNQSCTKENEKLKPKNWNNEKEEKYSICSKSDSKYFPEIKPVSRDGGFESEIDNGLISFSQHIPGIRASHSELKNDHQEPKRNTKLEDRFANKESLLEINGHNDMISDSFNNNNKSNTVDILTKNETVDQQSPVKITQVEDTILINPKRTEISGVKKLKDQSDNIRNGDEIKTIFSERTLVESILEEHLSDETLEDTNLSIKNHLTDNIEIKDSSSEKSITLNSTELIASYQKLSDSTSLKKIDEFGQHQIKESSIISTRNSISKSIMNILEPKNIKSSSDEYISNGIKSQSLLNDAKILGNTQNEQSKIYKDGEANPDKSESVKYEPQTNKVSKNAAKENYDNDDNTSDLNISPVSDTFSSLNIDPNPSEQFTTDMPHNTYDDVIVDKEKLNHQLNTTLINDQNNKFPTDSDFKTDIVSDQLLPPTTKKLTDNFEDKEDLNSKFSVFKNNGIHQYLNNEEYDLTETNEAKEYSTGNNIDAKLSADFGINTIDTKLASANNSFSQKYDTKGQIFDNIKENSNIHDIEQNIIPFSDQNITVGDDSFEIYSQPTKEEIRKESNNVVDMVCFLAENMYESINDKQNDDHQKHANVFKENDNLDESHDDLDMDHGDVKENFQNYPQFPSRESKGMSEQTALLTHGTSETMLETSGDDTKEDVMKKDCLIKVYEGSSNITSVKQSDVTIRFPLSQIKIEAKNQLKISVSKNKSSKGETTKVSNNTMIKHIQTTFNDEYDTSLNVQVMKIVSIFEEINLMKKAISDLKFQVKMLENSHFLLRQSIIGRKAKAKLVRVPNMRCICVRQRNSKHCVKKFNFIT